MGKKMKESDDFDPYWASLASGSEPLIEAYYEMAGKKVFNLQLRYWVEALTKFRDLDEEYNIKIEELLLIINLICNSLLILAGVNYKSTQQGDFVPPLLNLYKKWGLKEEKRELFNKLSKMNENYNNLSKHICKSPSREKLLSEINYSQVREYMKATQDIWIWVLNKKFGEKIPKSQLTFFRNEF